VVAIKALTRVADLSFSQNLSLNVTVDLPSDGVNHQHRITDENRYLKQTYEVCRVANELNHIDFIIAHR